MNKSKPAKIDDSQDWSAYMRVSSDAQREKQTIETQRCEIERHGLVPANRIYEDDGVSGMVPFAERTTGGKALLARLNEVARLGRTPRLLLYSLDRLGRDALDTLGTFALMMKLGVKLTTILEGDFEDTPEGHFKAVMHSGMAQYGRHRILRGTLDGLRRKAKDSGYTGGRRPFGYRKKDDLKTADLALDKDPIPGLKLSPFDVVRRIFRDAADGKSCQKIADWLNAMGVPTSKQSLKGAAKTGRESIWRPNSVRLIIMNPVYKGCLQWGRRTWIDKHLKLNPPDKVITIQRPELAMVDGALWAQANAALHANQILAMAHPKNDYLLHSLIHCGIEGCGCIYTGRGTHYACIGRHCAKRLYGKTRPPCVASPVRRTELEAVVWADIELYLAKPGALIRQLEKQMESESGKRRSVADDIAALESKLKELDSGRTMALRQLTRGKITEPQFDKEVTSIDREKAAIEGRLAELRKISTDAESQALAFGQARSMLEKLRAKVFPKGDTGQESMLPFEQRRWAVEALVERIVIVPGVGKPSIRIVYTFEPHLERGRKQWDDPGGLALDAMVRRSGSPGREIPASESATPFAPARGPASGPCPNRLPASSAPPARSPAAWRSHTQSPENRNRPKSPPRRCA